MRSEPGSAIQPKAQNGQSERADPVQYVPDIVLRYKSGRICSLCQDKMKNRLQQEAVCSVNPTEFNGLHKGVHDVSITLHCCSIRSVKAGEGDRIPVHKSLKEILSGT